MNRYKQTKASRLDLFTEVWTRILCDTRPSRIEVIYLFANTKDNQTAVLETGARIWRSNKQAIVLVCDGTTAHGYPGYKIWRRHLTKNGVPTKSIVPLTVGQNVNTLTETNALAMFIKISKIKNTSIISMPFHQVRAFVTTVSVLKKTKLSTPANIYNVVADSLDWKKMVIHSQGILKNTRAGLIKDEIHRIEKYQAKGDLVSLKAVKDYLDSRN